MSPVQERYWSAARASAHLDVVLGQLGDMVPHLKLLSAESAEVASAAARSLWTVRERLFEIIDDIDEPRIEEGSDGEP